MPIYEYSCKNCGEETEKLQKLSDPDWLDCPSCGKPGLVRTVSAAGFRLSGSGWYETDFKKDGKRNLTGEGGSSSSNSSDKPSSEKTERATKAKDASGSNKTKPASAQK